MGLAIIATLLMNTDSQILIVSYTNHALDQFLMGLLRYTDSIVRIGNQSKNESLDCFNIKQLCENGIADKRIKTSLFKLKGAYSEAVQEFNDLQSYVANNSESNETVFVKYAEIQVSVNRSSSKIPSKIILFASVCYSAVRPSFNRFLGCKRK